MDIALLQCPQLVLRHANAVDPSLHWQHHTACHLAHQAQRQHCFAIALVGAGHDRVYWVTICHMEKEVVSQVNISM
jgi:hypothetical protein